MKLIYKCYFGHLYIVTNLYGYQKKNEINKYIHVDIRNCTGL